MYFEVYVYLFVVGNPLVSNFMLSFAKGTDCKSDAYKFIICLITELVNVSTCIY